MASWLLNKNPDLSITNNLAKIKDQLQKSNFNIIMHSESFVKTDFLNKCIDSFNENIIYLDFDLMYSGYVAAQMIPKNNNVEIFRPQRNSMNVVISNVADKISRSKFLVVIDSLNGFNVLFNGKEYSRWINSVIMLLLSAGHQIGSSILITAMARRNEDNEWVLSPGGRHILFSNNSKMFFLKRTRFLFAMEPIH